MIIGNRNFAEGHTYVMGILNVTPDSFSDGGRYNSADAALRHALAMISDGAAIIDVGGESTRPGYTMISDEEEIERVCPVIERLKKETDVPISLDTYKSKVAAAGIAAGASLINDIWGLKYDPDMAGVIASNEVACCLMHNRNRDERPYNDFVPDLLDDLRETVAIAHAAGISDEKIILDPGVGFGKNYEENLLAIKHMGALHELGYPILLGTSRKSVIGLTLDLPKDEREEGTLATSILAVREGCMFVRAHDVKANFRGIKMAEAVLNA